MVSNIKVGGAEAQATDVLGNVYEYFLEQFALAEGRKGGEFYNPALGRAAARADAGAVPGPRVRPLLRLLRHVRPVG